MLTACASPDDDENPLDIAREKGVSPRLVMRIAEKIPFDDIITGIKEMLGALLSNDKPDWRAREIGIKLWLSYVIGLPVQRQHVIQERITTAPTVDTLLQNPATLDALERMLAAARAQQAKALEG